MKDKITKQWFKNWSNEYDNTLGKIARHHKLLELAVKRSGVRDGDKILDIGVGTGLLSLKFLKAADCAIIGIDSSEDMLAICRKKLKHLKLDGKIGIKRMDASSLRFKPGSFDIAASTVTLHHVVDKLAAMKKIYKALKPGGKLVIGDIDLDTTGKITDKKRLLRIMDYLRDELELALNDGGAVALARMFDNGKKHLFNEGEYCVSFSQWAAFCRKAGFRIASIVPLPEFTRFKVMVAVKPGK